MRGRSRPGVALVPANGVGPLSSISAFDHSTAHTGGSLLPELLLQVEPSGLGVQRRDNPALPALELGKRTPGAVVRLKPRGPGNAPWLPLRGTLRRPGWDSSGSGSLRLAATALQDTPLGALWLPFCGGQACPTRACAPFGRLLTLRTRVLSTLGDSALSCGWSASAKPEQCRRTRPSWPRHRSSFGRQPSGHPARMASALPRFRRHQVTTPRVT